MSGQTNVLDPTGDPIIEANLKNKDTRRNKVSLNEDHFNILPEKFVDYL